VRILGVDPGTLATGYGVVLADAHGGVRHLAHGVIRTHPKSPLWARLGVIHDGIAEVAAEHRAEVLALERCFVAQNIESALKLGHARGAIMVAALRHQLGVYEYAPTQIKAAVTGRGRADKHQVAQMVRIILGLQEAAPADASDALAAAICHAHGVPARALGVSQ
jgi:crossover junction endodeoxyribonuclease RuvC